MDEVEKYRGIYGDTSGRYARYGHSNHGAGAAKILEREGVSSVIDVGCGWNELASGLRQKGWRATGVDFACPGADLVADIVEGLPFSEKEFDWVTAFDMLEHVRPDQVDATLAEMARIGRRFCLSISYVPSVNKWQGQTLHPTVRTEEWWIAQLVRHGAIGVRKEGRYLTGRWERRLELPQETRVVLVGNGPAVLGRGLGPQIDAHDFVIRFNNYKIDGHEADVGTRTDLWSTFFRRIDNPLSHDRVICIHENDKPPAEIREAYYLPSAFYDRIRRMLQERAWVRQGMRGDVSHLLASSGLLVASYLLEVVGIERVSLIGFDHFSKKESSLHHYWINKAFKRPAEHDGDAEAAIFADLEAAGRVCYLR